MVKKINAEQFEQEAKKSAAALVGDTEQVVAGVYQELRSSKRKTDVEKINAYLEARKALQMAEM
jgi:hypothetical protein